MTQRGSATPRPQFSLVSAAYNVERFLDEFLESLARQTLSPNSFELIVVDDGSTDGTLAKLQEWRSNVEFSMIVLTQPNAGQGTARNRGIAAATGDWLAFPDPDDWVADDYLEEISRMIARAPHADMIAGRRLIFNEATGSTTDTHPLRRHFFQNHIISLERYPYYFHGHAPSAFVRRSRVNAENLQFSTLIRSNFEDGHFCVHYLLQIAEPVVAFVRDAVYYYRKRADGTSTLDRKNLDPEHFLSSPRDGYLDVLKAGSEAGGGRVPHWLQNFILYELSWYFAEDNRMNLGTVATGSVGEAFRATLGEITTYLEPGVVWNFEGSRLTLEARQALVHGFRSEPWCTPYVVMDALDKRKQLVRFTYRYANSEPQVVFKGSGLPLEPAHGKRRSIEYFGAEVLTEHIVWVPYNKTLTVTRDGLGFPIQRSWPRAERFVLRPRQVLELFGIRSKVGGAPRSLISRARTKVRALARGWLASVSRRLRDAAASSQLGGRKFSKAWILMDRTSDADDSGEVLFDYLRTHDAAVNAWFVISKASPSWGRLRTTYGRRVLAYGSWRWKVALRHAKFVISSHIDQPISDPPLYRRTGWKRSWRFVFLQHGVIKDDISRWLNLKDIAVFVTSTEAERGSIVGDHTHYKFTDKEVVLTGLPRFDRLYELSATSRTTGERPKRLVFAPTWRSWLNAPLASGETIRAIVDDFAETEYALNWLGLMASPRVREAAREHGIELCLIPHPNLRKIAEVADIPEHIRLIDLEDGSAQQHFVDAGALVTDYSSMAFNSAFLERTVVYFQFDADKYNAGAHIARPGYFDYARDGYGPVVSTLEEAEEALVSLISSQLEPAPLYRERLEQAFAVRDGQCSRRVVESIRGLDKVVKRAPETSAIPVLSELPD